MNHFLRKYKKILYNNNIKFYKDSFMKTVLLKA